MDYLDQKILGREKKTSKAFLDKNPFSKNELIAPKDVKVFRYWAAEKPTYIKFKISTREAAERIAANNGWAEAPTDDEFTAIAHCLGYYERNTEPAWLAEVEKRE